MGWLVRRRWLLIWVLSFAAIGVSFWLFPSPVVHVGTDTPGLVRFIFGYGMLFLLAFWGISREGLWSSRLRITARKAFVGLLGGVVVACVLVVADRHGMQSTAAHIRHSPLLYISTLLLVGPIEELLCRGYFFTRWAIRHPSPFALLFFGILASLMFATLHVFRDVATASTVSSTVSGTKLVLLAMTVQGLAGLALTFCYWVSTNLVYAMVLHSLWDMSIESHLFIAHPALILVFILLALSGTFIIRRYSQSRWERWRNQGMFRTNRRRRAPWATTLWVMYFLLSIANVIGDVAQLFGSHPLAWYYADAVEGVLEVLALLTYLYGMRALTRWMWKLLFPTIIIYDLVSSHYEHVGLTDSVLGIALSIPMYIVICRNGWRSARRRYSRGPYTL